MKLLLFDGVPAEGAELIISAAPKLTPISIWTACQSSEVVSSRQQQPISESNGDRCTLWQRKCLPDDLRGNRNRVARIGVGELASLVRCCVASRDEARRVVDG